MVENLSAYPIKATVNSTAAEVLTNVTKNVVNNNAEIAVGGRGEIQITYDVTDSSKAASLTIGNELAFEKIDSLSNIENLQYSSLLSTPKTIESYQEVTQDTYFYGYSAKIVDAPSGSKVSVKAEATLEDILTLGVTEVIIVRQSAGTLEELLASLDTSKVLEIDMSTMTASFETEGAREDISIILNSTNKFPQSYIANVVKIEVEEKQEVLRFTPINNGEAYEVGIRNVWEGGDIVIPSEYNGKPVTSISGFDASIKSDSTSPKGILFGYRHELNSDEYVNRPVSETFEGLLTLFEALVGGAENVPAEMRDKNNFFWGGFAGSTINSLTIPSSITSISETAFYECEVGSFLIEGSNSNYEVKNGALIEKNSKTLVKASKSFTSITNDVLVIGSYAFGSLKISNLVVPENVTSIQPYAFSNSTIDNLTINANIDTLYGYSFVTTIINNSLILPNTLLYIDSKAICNCNMYGQITIPSSVIIISDNAFYTGIGTEAYGFRVDSLKFEDASTIVDCPSAMTGLSYGFYTLTFMNEEPATNLILVELARGADKIYVPASAVDAYKAAEGWSDIAGLITAIS